MTINLILALVLLLAVPAAARAQDKSQVPEDYASWEVLQPEFESTGGGGIIIRGYAPKVIGSVCRTDFTATEPNGTVYENIIEFEAHPIQGGILCQNGKWRARNGSASGTTPLRVFIKDGLSRRSP
jgi:hypothetical protein